MEPRITSEPLKWTLIASPSGTTWTSEEEGASKLEEVMESDRQMFDGARLVGKSREGFGCRFEAPAQVRPFEWYVFETRWKCLRFLYLRSESDEVDEGIHREADKILQQCEIRVTEGTMALPNVTFGPKTNETDTYCVIRDLAPAPKIEKVCLTKRHAYVEAVKMAEQSEPQKGGLRDEYDY